MENKNNYTIEKLLDELDYSDDIDNINNEMKDVDTIYSTLKDHVMSMIQDMSSNKTNGPNRLGTNKPKLSHVYVSAQTSNLMTLLNFKSGIRKNLLELKNIEVEKRLKLISAIKKLGEGEDENDMSGATLAVLKKIFSEERNSGFKTRQIFSNDKESNLVFENGLTSDEIDRLIDSTMEDEGLNETILLQTRPKEELETNPEQILKNKFSDDDKSEESDEEHYPLEDVAVKNILIEDGYRLVIDNEVGEYYLVNSDLEILKKLEKDIDFTIGRENRCVELGLPLEDLDDVLAESEEE